MLITVFHLLHTISQVHPVIKKKKKADGLQQLGYYQYLCIPNGYAQTPMLNLLATAWAKEKIISTLLLWNYAMLKDADRIPWSTHFQTNGFWGFEIQYDGDIFRQI